jgi:hypothetical protein
VVFVDDQRETVVEREFLKGDCRSRRPSLPAGGMSKRRIPQAGRRESVETF